ncbi:hypothetical protein MUK51_10955 [Sphingobacterium faecium]|uniref:hypothetical protein n=1 Tax=Sphingobacterium faecium TaxID=34087 RepID=UPI0021B55329|nr:hypothetical protein [Sphingobacterium faecium]UXD67746.1 hypothetical protein MUK51_10955 [Sphingobacterium faecium]
MKRIFLTSLLFILLSIVNGQDLKRVHPVFIEIDNRNPDKATYGDDQITIKFINIENGTFKIELNNLTDKNIEFVRKKSYTVVDGRSNDTYIGYERDNVNTYLSNDLIPKGTKTDVTLHLESFDLKKVKKYYLEHNKPKHNTLVLIFDIDGKEKEVEFDIAIYPKNKKG